MVGTSRSIMVVIPARGPFNLATSEATGVLGLYCPLLHSYVNLTLPMAGWCVNVVFTCSLLYRCDIINIIINDID